MRLCPLMHQIDREAFENAAWRVMNQLDSALRLAIETELRLEEWDALVAEVESEL